MSIVEYRGLFVFGNQKCEIESFIKGQAFLSATICFGGCLNIY